jgi:histidinol phosphatase-like enzyme
VSSGAAGGRHHLELARSIMVGDMATDREFAQAAGLAAFFRAREFFGAGFSVGSIALS